MENECALQSGKVINFVRNQCTEYSARFLPNVRGGLNIPT